MIVVSVSATKSYLHAWTQCVKSIATAAAHHEEGVFIFATDTSKEAKDAEEALKSLLPENWKIHTLRSKFGEDEKNYDKTAQLRIAVLQGAAFAFARTKLKADLFWNVESDNIVPPNALRMLEWTLQMPTETGAPYYDIAAATYSNGLFLGGFGTQQNPIAEDFLPRERILPPRMLVCLDACEKRLGEMDQRQKEKLPVALKELSKEQARLQRLHRRAKTKPPDGTIWQVIAKHGWRRRGWMDFAYPGIGKGAIVPIDWCGLGCTLLSKRALALADFNGYDGGGTQDLFLCWHRWHPAKLRIACVPHVVCDHVKKGKREVVKMVNGKQVKEVVEEIIHHRAYHEEDPAQAGHLRVRSQPWVPL